MHRWVLVGSELGDRGRRRVHGPRRSNRFDQSGRWHRRNNRRLEKVANHAQGHPIELVDPSKTLLQQLLTWREIPIETTPLWYLTPSIVRMHLNLNETVDFRWQTTLID